MENKKKTYQEDKSVVSQVKECSSITTAIAIVAEAIDSLKNSKERNV